jgi:hypothetical protein
MALGENITSYILANHSHIQVEEWHKQGSAVTFDSGKNQRIVSGSMGALEMTVSYKNIDQDQFDVLKLYYEYFYSRVFILNAGNNIDWRDKHLGNYSNTWAFRDFKFSLGVDLRWTGTITLVSSLFFDYYQYQNLHVQTGSYSPTISTDSSFTTLLNTINPYALNIEYLNNSIFSSVGQSVRHIKDKSLRKKWKMSWLLQESDFLELLMFYRKRGGIMGEFGVPENGINILIYYIADDYIADDYIETGNIINSMFMNDGFKYDKRIDGIYNCQTEMVEVI